MGMRLDFGWRGAVRAGGATAGELRVMLLAVGLGMLCAMTARSAPGARPDPAQAGLGSPDHHQVQEGVEPPIADLLSTCGGPENNLVQFGSPSIPPIPADFFGPGSDPFIGTVVYQGVPIEPGITGDADTVVERAGDPVLPIDPLGAMGTIPIQIVALELRSVSPITVTFNGGMDPEQWDVDITLSDVPSPPGQLTATKTDPNGGSFDATLPVQPRFIFTKVGDPDQVQAIDTGLLLLPPVILEIGGGRFVHTVNPALNLLVPPTSQWTPGVLEVVPGDINSQVLVPTTGITNTFDVFHTVCTAKPKEGRCEVTLNDIPKNQSACTTTTNGDGSKNIKVTFEMDAAFRDNCACCEYRQEVKGEFKLKGKKVNHEMNTGVWLMKNAYKEDGFGTPTPAGTNPHYGHRAEGLNPAHDRYSNPANRGAGCNYDGSDAPGWNRIKAGVTYSFELDFRGKIIDTCNGTDVRTHTWDVDCSGTAFGPFPDPLVEVIFETVLDGRGTILGVYVYPGDILTVVASISNGDGLVPIDAADVNIDVPGLALISSPDPGPLPETTLGGVNSQAIYDFDHPPGSPQLLLVTLTVGGESQDFDVDVTPACPWDCDGTIDGIVSVLDLLAVLAQWDLTNPPCDGGGTCDFDGNGCVGVADLLKVLAHYDPAGLGCPQ